MLESFRGNVNCAKDSHNVTSHVGTPKNVSGENMTRPGEVKNVPKTAKNVIIHAFRLFRPRAAKAMGCLVGPWEVIGKE